MNILLIDSFPQEFLSDLEKLPVSVQYEPSLNRAQILERLPSTHILIMNSRIQVDKEAIDIAVNLKMVIRAGVGMDHIDQTYLEEKGVIVLNTKGANADAVGEHTIGMLLGLRHNILKADRAVRRFEWLREENRGWEIGGKTVGIIGFGHTGSAVARRLRGFECELLAYDKYNPQIEDDYVKSVDLAEIFEKSDILTLHVPLTDETRGWVNDHFLNQFKKPIFFLNLARGPIVQLDALVRALDDGRVKGAGLDVLINEKLHTLTPDQKTLYENLFSRENVILTPHIGGWTVESLANINQMILAFVNALIED